MSREAVRICCSVGLRRRRFLDADRDDALDDVFDDPGEPFFFFFYINTHSIPHIS